MVGAVLRIRYELTQLVNEGPIFTTYAARDRVQATDVCVRLVRAPYAEEPAFVQKMRDVVQRYAGIQHPGVEAMIDVDDDEGAPFLVSEPTQGVMLAERIRKLAPFSVPVAVSSAISLCEGLEAIHAIGLAHGDVSSQSTVSLPDGQMRLQLPGMWQAYATSAGAAAAILPSMAPYLAPEISAGGMPDPISDVYSAGVLLYELITGRLPYNADTPISMALKHATGTVPSVRMYNPSVPAVLDEIVKKALSKNPADRYQTASALLSDLRVLQDALRFGRTVTWPISIAAVVPQVAPMPKTVPIKKELPKPEPKAKRERDVPLYFVIPMTILLAVAATMLGTYFFFVSSKPPEVKVPSLVGMTLQEARETVRPSKLDIEIGDRRSSEKVAADHIISSDPDAGDTVRQGSHIRVLMSSGSGLVPVPNLKGSSVDQARSTLSALHLDLDDNIETRRSSKVDAGLIISQVPPGGSKIDQTTKVKIVVSSGDDDRSDPPPDQTAETKVYTLKVKLAGIPKAVTVRIDIVDDRGTRTVYEQQHDPEETIELSTRGTGKEVKFRIYYDNELMKEVKQGSELGSPVEPGINDNNDNGDNGQ